MKEPWVPMGCFYPSWNRGNCTFDPNLEIRIIRGGATCGCVEQVGGCWISVCGNGLLFKAGFVGFLMRPKLSNNWMKTRYFTKHPKFNLFRKVFGFCSPWKMMLGRRSLPLRDEQVELEGCNLVIFLWSICDRFKVSTRKSPRLTDRESREKT